MPLHVAVVCAASIRRALGSQRIEKATDLLLRRIPHLHGRRGGTLVRFVVDDRRIQFVVLVVHGSSGAWFFGVWKSSPHAGNAPDRRRSDAPLVPVAGRDSLARTLGTIGTSPRSW